MSLNIADSNINKTPQIYEESYYDYEILKQIGQGAFSSIYKVRRKSDSKYYSAKRIEIEKLKHLDKVNEIELLSKLDSIHVIKYITSFRYEKYLYIILELAEKGDLYTVNYNLNCLLYST